MSAIAYTRFRRKLAKVFDELADTQQPILITRADGKDAVLVPRAQWESTMETLHLLSSPANRRALKKSLRQLERGELVEKAID